MALQCGDRVELESTGAYVTTYASQRFNGFAPLAEHYI
jgi:ornithine decarboxylase